MIVRCIQPVEGEKWYFYGLSADRTMIKLYHQVLHTLDQVLEDKKGFREGWDDRNSILGTKYEEPIIVKGDRGCHGKYKIWLVVMFTGLYLQTLLVGGGVQHYKLC